MGCSKVSGVRGLVAGAAAGLMALGMLAPLGVRAQTLRMGVGAQVTSIDPEYHNISPNNAFASMVYGALVETDGQSRLRPGLALSWTPVAETVWEFKLRPNVTFHNGQPFTADDVAFTFERIPTVLNSPGSYSTYIYSIAKVEIVDPLTLRLHTKGGGPAAAGQPLADLDPQPGHACRGGDGGLQLGQARDRHGAVPRRIGPLRGPDRA